MHRVHVTSTVKSKYSKSCYWNNPVNVIIFCCTKSILLTGFHCTFYFVLGCLTVFYLYFALTRDCILHLGQLEKTRKTFNMPISICDGHRFHISYFACGLASFLQTVCTVLFAPQCQRLVHPKEPICDI